MKRSLIFALAVFAVGQAAWAGSIGHYSGCKQAPKSQYDACMKCVGGGSYWQPAFNACGMVEGMHKSKSVGTDKPPPRPSAMPKTGKEYVTITPAPFEIGARPTDADKGDFEVFELKVTLTHSFKMKTTEVTQGEWLYVMGAVTPSWEKALGLEYPAASVSWVDAARYMNALSKLENLEPCYEIKKGLVSWPKGFECAGYRLPTEAEWEFAARGGSEEPRYGDVSKIAWYYDNSDGVPHPVGKKQKNAYGLYDMLGGVYEWVWDKYEFKPYEDDVTDPIVGPSQASESEDRVSRGGAWDTKDYDVRATHRFRNLANSGGKSQGFRPVRTVLKK